MAATPARRTDRCVQHEFRMDCASVAARTRALRAPAPPASSASPHQRCHTYTTRTQIVGGVLIAQPFYAASLYREGRAPEGAAAAPGVAALLAARASSNSTTSSSSSALAAAVPPAVPEEQPADMAAAAAVADGGNVSGSSSTASLELVPLTAQQLAAAGASGGDPIGGGAAPDCGPAAARLPPAAAVLGRLLSPAALSEFKWARAPAVALFGACATPDAALDACAAARVPVSASVAGPHAEVLATQLEVFLKAHRFDEHRAWVM